MKSAQVTGECRAGAGRRRAARIFAALASEARLCIITELAARGERCVCELVGCCGLGWSTVSHHLAILKEAGIVDRERRGQQMFYRLSLPCVAEFLRCIEGGAGVPGGAARRTGRGRAPLRPARFADRGGERL